MAGKALIFSAPSGSGKTTIVKHLLKNNPDLGFSISASTRPRLSRVEAEIEKPKSGLFFKRCLTIVVLPEPDVPSDLIQELQTQINQKIS